MSATKLDYFLISTFAAVSVSACSSMGSPDVSAADYKIPQRYDAGPDRVYVNGRQTNGQQVRGTLLNSRLANGRILNGSFENNVLNGEPISLVYVDTAAGASYKGPGLVGTAVTGQLPDGSTRELRFAGYDATTVPGAHLYLVNYADSGESVCGNRDGLPIWTAILPQLFDGTTGDEIAGDPNKYTFSCRFGAIQKCQEAGYLKNGTARERKSGVDRIRRLSDYHAACVKMMRADYCGNAIPHTFEGASVNYYDHLVGGNQAVTASDGQDGFYLESEWDADGAHCINMTRWMPNTLSSLAMNQSSANPDFEYVRLNCPARFAFPVPLASGGMSVPDRACGASSNWNTSVGWDQYAENTPQQLGRSKIRTNTMMNKYGLP